MSTIPDYSNYTLEELEDVYYAVDRNKYPDNFKAIVAELEKRRSEIKTEKYIDTEDIDPKDPDADTVPLMPVKKLPIQEIVKTAFSVSWKLKYGLLSVLIFPYLLITLLEILNPFIYSKLGLIAIFIINTIKSIIYASFAVTCHRFILLGKDSVPNFGLLIPSIREFRFWGWTMGIGFIIAVGGGLLLFLLNLSGIVSKVTWIFIMFIPVFYLMARWTLIFPAVAVDQQPSLAWAWKQSRTNGLRLFLLLSIPVLPFFGINFLLHEKSSLILSGVVLLFTFIFTVIGIIFISLSYKELCLQDNAFNNNQELTS